MTLRAFVGLAIAWALAGCDETIDQEYSSKAEAAAAGVFRSFMPDVLPDDSDRIVVAWDIDTNVHCSVSTFPADSTPGVAARLAALGFEPSTAVPLPRLRCPFEADSVDGLLARRSAERPELALALALDGHLFAWWVRSSSAYP